MAVNLSWKCDAVFRFYDSSLQLIGVPIIGLEPEFQPVANYLLPSIISHKQDAGDMYLQVNRLQILKECKRCCLNSCIQTFFSLVPFIISFLTIIYSCFKISRAGWPNFFLTLRYRFWACLSTWKGVFVACSFPQITEVWHAC